jgi:hypothetical protein
MPVCLLFHYTTEVQRQSYVGKFLKKIPGFSLISAIWRVSFRLVLAIPMADIASSAVKIIRASAGHFNIPGMPQAPRRLAETPNIKIEIVLYPVGQRLDCKTV